MIGKLTEEQKRYLADELLQVWQDGMRSKPMNWSDFENKAVHVGLHLINLGNTQSIKEVADKLALEVEIRHQGESNRLSRALTEYRKVVK